MFVFCVSHQSGPKRGINSLLRYANKNQWSDSDFNSEKPVLLTSSHLFKHEVESVLLLKELYQLQDVSIMRKKKGRMKPGKRRSLFAFWKKDNSQPHISRMPTSRSQKITVLLCLSQHLAFKMELFL